MRPPQRSMMHKDCKQDDNRQRNANQPKQCTFSEAHYSLHNVSLIHKLGYFDLVPAMLSVRIVVRIPVHIRIAQGARLCAAVPKWTKVYDEIFR